MSSNGSRGRSPALLKFGAVTLATSLLSACSTLPTNGPTAAQVRRDVASNQNILGYQIVDVDSHALPAAEQDPGAGRLASFARGGNAIGRLGPGDVLSVEIYEIGAGLFSTSRTSLGGAAEDMGPASSASGGALTGGIVVDSDGYISVPYAGRLQVAGLTPQEAQEKILAGLKGKSQNPQVVVSVRQNVHNTVMVMGAVQKPGRIDLLPTNERLLDAIAEAGGLNMVTTVSGSTTTGVGPQDMLIRFTRDGRTIEQRMATIVMGGQDDIPLLPGDRVEVVRQPMTFSVFGAVDRISQMPFESERLSLAEALARAGGPSDSRADPRSIYVMRLLQDGAAVPNGTSADKPKAIIYRFNMMQVSTYFAAQQFAMRDKDLIYIANASSNQPAKLVQILNLLFTPVYSVRAAAR